MATFCQFLYSTSKICLLNVLENALAIVNKIFACFWPLIAFRPNSNLYLAQASSRKIHLVDFWADLDFIFMNSKQSW